MRQPISSSEDYKFRFLIVIVLILGIFFRFFHLDRKVYWFDEVYTSFRAAGYTSQAIDRNIFQNRIIDIDQLQEFQKIKPKSRLQDTIYSLASEDPQHPPLYFLCARFWMHIFGGSIAASRFLPVLISLFSLPLMYGLAMELFDSQLTAILATGLLAVSPFDILFAQTARQYSLLTVAVIGSNYLFTKTIKDPSLKNWCFYGLLMVIGLYTHPFFILTLIAHSVFIVCRYFYQKQNYLQNNFNFSLTNTISIFLYSPWLLVLYENSEQALQTTNWASTKTNYLDLLGQWVLSFTSLFIDINLNSHFVWTYLFRLPIIGLIIFAIYTLCDQKRENLDRQLLILTSIFVPFLILAIPDLLFSSKRSGVTRYLISCFPGIQLAVAYCFSVKIFTFDRFEQLWRSILILLFSLSILSCTISSFAYSWWSKGISYSNYEIAQIINERKAPIIISDRGDDYTNKGNLISLSYLLNSDVRLLLLTYPPDSEAIKSIKFASPSSVFLFQPSKKLKEIMQLQEIEIMPISPQRILWRVI